MSSDHLVEAGGNDEAPERTYSMTEKASGVLGAVLVLVAVAWFVWGQFEPGVAPDERTVERDGSGKVIKDVSKDAPLPLTTVLPVLLLAFGLLSPFADELNVAGLASWKRRKKELEETKNEVTVTLLNATPALVAAAALPAATTGDEPLPDAKADEALEPPPNALTLWKHELGPAWRLRTYRTPALERLVADGPDLATAPADVRSAVARLADAGASDLEPVAQWAKSRTGLLSALATAVDAMSRGTASDGMSDSASASAAALSAELREVIRQSAT